MSQSSASNETGANASLSGHFMNVVKSFIGSNYLAIPHVFLLGGIYFGPAGMSMIAILTGYCCTLLVRVRQTLRDKGGLPCTTYGQVTSSVMGGSGYAFVEAALLLTQFGFCVGYMVFMGTALETLFGVTFWQACLLLSGPLMVVVCVRELSAFTSCSYIANFALLVSFVLLIATNIGGIEKHGFSDESSPDLTKLPIFFGVIIACFEGIGTVLPVEGAMGDLSDVYPKFLWAVMAIMSVLFSLFGILGVGNYGASVCGIILQNLSGGGESDAIKGCIVVGLFFTYAFQMFPVTEMLEAKLARFMDWREGTSTGGAAFALTKHDASQKEHELIRADSKVSCDGGPPADEETASSPGENGNTTAVASDSSVPDPNQTSSTSASVDLVSVNVRFSLSHEMQADGEYEDQGSRLKRLGLFRAVALRVVLVSATAIIAIGVPDFILLISFVGSLGATFLAFIMPCILAEKVLSPSPLELITFRSVLCLGFIFMILGSSLSLYSIIEVLAFNKTDGC